MAVLAMAQMALMMQGICPALALATSDADLRRTVQQARVPVWLPFEVLREQRDTLTTWGVTSDSLAAWLANRLNAEELVLVKACAVEPSMDLAGCVAAGILDQEFLRFTRDAAYTVTLLNRVDLARVRGLLLNGGAAR
jgi:aspartokinase-like uncharacterized kinase